MNLPKKLHTLGRGASYEHQDNQLCRHQRIQKAEKNQQKEQAMI